MINQAHRSLQDCFLKRKRVYLSISLTACMRVERIQELTVALPSSQSPSSSSSSAGPPFFDLPSLSPKNSSNLIQTRNTSANLYLVSSPTTLFNSLNALFASSLAIVAAILALSSTSFVTSAILHLLSAASSNLQKKPSSIALRYFMTNYPSSATNKYE